MNKKCPSHVGSGAALALAVWLAGCASGPICASDSKQVSHSFSCDMWFDGWVATIDLLEYSYGDKLQMLDKKVRPGQQSLGCGTVIAAMPVAEFLYVKWRLKASGEVIEDRVDLRGRLPTNVVGHEVTFLIDGRQLYVYVVTPTRITPMLPGQPLKTWRSQFRASYEIYPNNQLKPQGGRHGDDSSGHARCGSDGRT